VVGRILGVDAARLVGQLVVSLAHADDMDRVRALVADVVAGRPMARPLEWRLWDASGHWRQVETIAADLRADPSVGQIVLTTRDVGARKTLEQQLTQVTFHDLLTNLPNRALFHDRLGQALASGKRAGRPTTVLFLGLDAFRRVNESLGHAAGDRLLEECARRLQSSVRAADTCARLGGDEFGVLLDGDPSAEDRSVVADRILAAFRQPMSASQGPLHLTVSLGMATTVGPARTRSACCETPAGEVGRARRGRRSDGHVRADDAARRAEPGRARDRTPWAVAQGQLVLLYQPIVDLQTGELAGAEALVAGTIRPVGGSVPACSSHLPRRPG